MTYSLTCVIINISYITNAKPSKKTTVKQKDKETKMVKDVFIHLLIQLIYFIGSVYLVGFLIAQLNKAFYRMFNSKTVCYVLGVIGTPIHELSHALMCLIFGHRIVEMRLFQVDEDDNKLGYVNHSYNPKNLYHQIGNYFIGVAPILVGTIIICVLMWLMLPSTYSEVSTYINEIIKSNSNGFSLSIFKSAFGIIKALFTNITEGFMWFLFVILVLCISMHMSLSGADIKGSLKAIPIISVILLAVNFIVRLISKQAYSSFTDALNTAGSYLIAVLVMSLIFAIFIVLIALAVKLIIGIFSRR